MKTTIMLATLAMALVLPGQALADDVVVGTLDGRCYRTYYLSCWAGQRSVAIAVGQGVTDLDLAVYDPYGRLVTADLDGTDRCVVAWYATIRGTYRIVVLNSGWRRTRYVLRVARS